MSLFGLGDFGEGFVTGLADSASDAIQKDMDAVRARIEKLSDFQANKIIKDQEEREEEIRDAVKQLKRASKVFGNDPNAKKYASAILEREGGIEGLNEVVERFRKAKIANPSLNLGSYFEQSSEEFPDVSFREIASSAIPRRTATAVELPEDIASGGAGNLLSNIGLDQKISKRVSRNVAEQTAAAGIAPLTDTDITLPSLAFNDEQFLLDTSSVQEGMRYLERQRALESNTPERNEELDKLYDEKVRFAAESGADIDAMNGIENQLSRLDITMNPETGKAEGVDASKYEQLQAQKRELQFKMDMANAGTDKKAQLLVQASYARSLGNIDEATRLERQAEDLAGTPAFKTTIERAERDLRNLDPASPTYEEDRQKLIDIIRDTKEEQKNLQDETGVFEVTNQDIAQMQRDVFSSFRTALSFSPMLNNLSFTDGFPDWNDFASRKGEDAKKAAEAEYNRLFYESVDMFGGKDITSIKSNKVFQAYKKRLINQGRYIPLSERDAGTGAGGTGAGDTGTGGEEAALTMPEVKGTVGEDISAEQVIKSQKLYPDDTAGVDAFIAAVAGKSEDEAGTIDEQVASFTKLGYSPEFTEELRTKLKNAAPDPETLKRQEDLEKAIQIIDNTSGFASKEIRTISKQMGISTEAATELHTNAMALKKQRDLDEVESVADDSVTKMANILRNTDDIDQWNRVAAKYMEETGRDMEATKKAFPPPAKKLNRGGLMARQ